MPGNKAILGKRKRDEYEENFYISTNNKKNDDDNSTTAETNSIEKLTST
mgnify:CR=1 FL=1